MAKQTEQNDGVRRALFFEMETVALGARRIRFEVLKRILQEQRIGLEPVEFSRWCLGSPDAYMESFLARKGYDLSTPAQVAERLRGETLSRLMQKDCLMNPDLVPWLDQALASHANIAAITALPQEPAEAIAQRLHFEKWGVQVVACGENRSYRHPETWISAAAHVGRSPQASLAIVTGADFAEASLMAGFAVVAVPDEFTEFQDFSGVLRVCSSLKDATFDECKLQSNY